MIFYALYIFAKVFSVAGCIEKLMRLVGINVFIDVSFSRFESDVQLVGFPIMRGGLDMAGIQRSKFKCHDVPTVGTSPVRPRRVSAVRAVTDPPGA